MGKMAKIKYLVAINEDYYPAVYEFDNEEEAKNKYDELVEEYTTRPVTFENKTIYFCKIVEQFEVKDQRGKL
jgi:hypothetical protein